jgi:chromosome segregation ATPase
MTGVTNNGDRTTAAVLARRQHAARLLLDVEEALRKIRKERSRATFRAVATRAGVSRTFLYENAEARRLVEAAIATAGARHRTTTGTHDRTAESSWRERALNAEDALTAAHREIDVQRRRIAELLGHIRDLAPRDAQATVDRLVAENTALAQRVRQLDDGRRLLTERLEAARSNNRFLDRRLSDLEARLLDYEISEHAASRPRTAVSDGLGTHSQVKAARR